MLRHLDILHNVFHTFAKVLTWRICLTIKVLLVVDDFLDSLGPNVCFMGNSVRRN